MPRIDANVLHFINFYYVDHIFMSILIYFNGFRLSKSYYYLADYEIKKEFCSSLIYNTKIVQHIPN